MSLPARQQRVLDAMESALEACEPRMKGMFEIFTRLTKGDGPTRAERLPLRRRQAWRLSAWRLSAWRVPAWRVPSHAVMLFPVIAAVVIMTGLVISVAAGGASACGITYAPAASQQAAKCAPAPNLGPRTGPVRFVLSK